MATSVSSTTSTTATRLLGCSTPIRQLEEGSAPPRTTMSPPALIAKLDEPASSRIADARSTDQPFTRPEGSTTTRDAARTSK